MKKIICLILSIILCISFVSCNEIDSESSEPTKPSLDAKQEVINICCSYSRCTTIKGFETGTLYKYETENGYEVIAKGSYYPVDAYGDMGDKMLFDIEFEATWDGEKDYYDISVTKKNIRKKY